MADAERATADRATTRRKGGLSRHTATGSAAAIAAVASGLLLDVVIATVFGAGRVTDAFFVAARIPMGITAIVMVVANQALVPTFSTVFTKEGDKAAWRLASRLLCLTAVVSGLICVAISLLAGPLMTIQAPGLDDRARDLAATTGALMFVVAPLAAMAEILRALLNARYSFAAPAAMHVVLNGVAAALVVALPHTVTSLAVAYVAGAAGQVAFMALMAARRGFRLTPSFGLRDRDVRATVKLCFRPTAGAALNPLARIGEQAVVSFLPAGSVTILNYGYRLISAIGGSVFFRSVVSAMVPRLTEAVARDDRDAEVAATRQGLRLMVLLAFPLTAALAVLAPPGVELLFRRGNFSGEDTGLLGLVLAVYAASLVGSGVQRALLAPFYARLDTRTPLRNTAYGVVTNLALLLPVAAIGAGRSQVVGVAMAYSVAQYVNVGHAWWRLRATTGFRSAGLAGFALRVAVASGAAAAAMASILAVTDHAAGLLPLWRTAASAALGALVLGVSARVVFGRDIRAALRGLDRRVAPA